MDPWFSPSQLYAALGISITVVFLLYTLKMFFVLLDHINGFTEFKTSAWKDSIMTQDWEDFGVLWGEVIRIYEKKIGGHRITLKADAYNILVIGFIGTLQGMNESFSALDAAIRSSGVNPATAMTSLLKGGLSTALISSLVCALVAFLVMTYISFSEKKKNELLHNLYVETYQIYKNQE